MLKILLVEDDDVLRKTLRLMIEKLGHSVLEAGSGEESLMIFDQKRPDVVIVDLILPGKDGVEIIRDLRRKHPALKIIAISGAGRITTTNYLDVAKAQGADFVLAKPFSNAELSVLIEQLGNPAAAPASTPPA